LRPRGRAILAALPLLVLFSSEGHARQSPVDVGLIARVEPSILVPKLLYEPKEGIAIELSLLNPARVPVDVPEKCLTAESVTITRVGSDAPLHGSGRPLDRGPLTLAPGATRKIDIGLTARYRIKQAGRYRLSWECGEWRTDHYEFFVGAPYDRDKDRVAVVTTDLGTMELMMMPEQAPVHVRNFVQLARAGYYDDMIFYRILPGTQAEAGDRTGSGTGGWDHQIAAEIDRGISPGKGLVGAVRRESTVTSASMFFILLDAQPGYQGLHTFFAYVRSGMEVVDALGAVEVSGEKGIGAFRPAKSIFIRKIEIKAP